MESLTRNELEQFYADALAINATFRSENERLKRQVNDQAQELEQLKRKAVDVKNAFAFGGRDDVLHASGRLVDYLIEQGHN